VQAGEVTLLFQLLAPPPPRPRPRLPSSVRGSVWSHLDVLFAGVALVSLVAHLALVVYLRAVDWPRSPDPEALLDEFPRMRLPRPPAPPPAAKPATPAAPEAPAHQPVARRPPPAPRPGPTRDELRLAVGRMGINQVLTAKGGQSPLADLLRPGLVDRDLEQALQRVGGLTTASAGTLPVGRDGGGPGRIVSVGDLRGDGAIAAPTDVGPRGERSVARVQPSPPVVDDGTANPAELARVVRQGMAAIRACYERALKRDPRLAGKLVVRFTITPAGTVSLVEVEDDSLGDAEVARCLREVFRRWRFPPPTGGPAEVSFPFVFQPSS
jgi:TonB family protein